jgi:hypothetical protein
MALIQFYKFSADALFTKSEQAPYYCHSLWREAWSEQARAGKAKLHEPVPTDFAQDLDVHSEWERLNKSYGKQRVKDAFGNFLMFENLFKQEAEKTAKLRNLGPVNGQVWIIVAPAEEIDGETKAALAADQKSKDITKPEADTEAEEAALADRLAALEKREAELAAREKALAAQAQPAAPTNTAAVAEDAPAAAAAPVAADTPAPKKRGRPAKKAVAAAAADEA